MLRRLFISGSFGILLLLTASQEHPVRQLAPGVYSWQGDTKLRKPANCTWVIFKDYVFVIDANFPWGAREILPEIRKTTDKPIRFVFDTHYHSDHTFGNSVFVDAGASIICSQPCANEMAAKARPQWDKWKETGPHSLEGARFVLPGIVFADQMAFDDGERRVELIRVGPGHSIGDAVAYLPKEKILVTGDLCVNWTSGNNVSDPDADHDNWIRILDKLATMDVTTIVPGHGDLGTTDALRRQREYLADMLRQVRAGIAAGKSADQLAETVDLSRHQPLGVNSQANARSIRGMYRRLAAR